MKIAIPSPAITPPLNVWLPPEGDYRAVLKSAKREMSGKIRFVFWVIVPNSPLRYCAGKNYFNDLSIGSALRNDLFTWRGHDLTPEELREGSIETNQLLHREADIQIAHIENDGYDKPFVFIHAIYPPGTLIRMMPAQYPQNN